MFACHAVVPPLLSIIAIEAEERVPMDRIGIGFWGRMSVNELIDCVYLADQKGYESAYLIESSADVFGVLSACARETSNIILATDVATAFTRNPTTIATAATTVDTLSAGRFRLGLGIGHSEIHQARDNLELGRPLPLLTGPSAGSAKQPTLSAPS